MKRREDKGRLPPFVPLLKETLASPAWRAMSHGARNLYVALKLRYSSNFHNNGRIYLSRRVAMKELGEGRANRTQVARWFRELQFYGFIVLIRPGRLGGPNAGPGVDLNAGPPLGLMLARDSVSLPNPVLDIFGGVS
jgi:hypothetical protein